MFSRVITITSEFRNVNDPERKRTCKTCFVCVYLLFNFVVHTGAHVAELFTGQSPRQATTPFAPVLMRTYCKMKLNKIDLSYLQLYISLGNWIKEREQSDLYKLSTHQISVSAVILPLRTKLWGRMSPLGVTAEMTVAHLPEKHNSAIRCYSTNTKRHRVCHIGRGNYGHPELKMPRALWF